ncbi:hypothetical protein [Gloeocapsa sp. PCC 73106]|uniref:Orn/Lys/Arg family decarboxylase n=1 Tax=Gloeocapsa sp. PCC 73106 TaxID=102232 RepID=UPI001EE66E26|nr:hypothetical protein [Gloeocapsa sp. PCC 73106]
MPSLTSYGRSEWELWLPNILHREWRYRRDPLRGVKKKGLICPYPPGIPVLMPGKRITTEAIGYLQQVTQAGAMITGCQDASLETILILSKHF